MRIWRNRQTRKIQDLMTLGHAGSSPVIRTKDKTHFQIFRSAFCFFTIDYLYLIVKLK